MYRSLDHRGRREENEHRVQEHLRCTIMIHIKAPLKSDTNYVTLALASAA